MTKLTYYIRRHKHLRRFCKLLLNLSTLSLLGFLVWFGIKLFTRQLAFDSIIGSAIFIVAFVGFILLCRIGLRNDWQPSIKITVVSLVGLFLITAFGGIQPMMHYKDIIVDKVKEYIVDEIPQYIQSPIDTTISIELVRLGLYRVTLNIIPTATAQLDTPYKVEVTSSYWSWAYEWDILWSENPEFKAPEARGFHNIERTFLITEDNPLYEHISQLEYRKFVQSYNAWTMSEIEADYQNELGKLVKVRVIK